MLKYWIWLQNVMGFASGRTDEILSKYENPKQLYEDRMNADKILKTLTKRDFSRLSSVWSGIPSIRSREILSIPAFFALAIALSTSLHPPRLPRIFLSESSALCKPMEMRLIPLFATTEKSKPESAPPVSEGLHSRVASQS